MKKLIIDTDIGDDIDDAFALALAGRMPEAEIVGVTTVFRNTKARAQLAEKLLETLGLSVPVFAGERFPEKEPIRPFGKDRAGAPEEAIPCQWEEAYARYSVREGAVEFLAESAEKYGSDLTIAPIGPLTSLARAIERYPESMKKVGKIVSMGGSFQTFQPEWNYLCDPEAAERVIASGIPFYAVGLDVTLQCPLEAGLLEKFHASKDPVNQLLCLWLDRWFGFFGFEKSVMHDPLVIASIFSDVCRFQKRFVKIDLQGERGAVFVSDQPSEGFPVFVAETVDRERFYEIVKANLL